MVGRQIRARKEVCYNQEALELGQYSDDDDVPISLRRGGENVTKKPFRKSMSPAEASGSDGSDKDVSEGATSDSKDEGSGSDSEEGSEDSTTGKKSMPKAQVVRRQPRRVAASRKLLKEEGTDSDSGASEKDYDSDRGYRPDKQLKRQQRTGKRGAECSPARPARALRARKSAQLASMAEPPSDIEEDSDAPGADMQDSSGAEDEEDADSEGASDEEGACEEGSDEDEKSKDGKTKPKGREAQGSGRASRPVRAARTKPAAKLTSAAAAREESAPKRKARINYAGICKVLDERQGAAGQELFVIFSGQSYRKAQWIPAKPFRDMPKGQILFRSYWNSRLKGQDENLVNGILPEWLQVERIIATRRGQRGAQQYLTKWCGLPYTDATWEAEEDLADDQEMVEAFEARERVPKKERKRVPKDDELPQFLNDRALRDYQVTSLRWMMSNQMENRNCILGDEMGLGKTAQSIATLEFQRQLLGNRGPFLVIAPLTTLGHWNREIITWTGMNVIQYCGTGEDRKMIQEYEFDYSSSSYSQASLQQDLKPVKFDVLLTSYEILLKDKNVFLNFGNGGRFETVIIDEAHRMKSVKSATRAVLEKMDIRWLLLLTGTPVQNNMKEVFGIMNLLDPERYGDEEDFYESFGGDAETPTVEQVRALQEELRPLLLRRMKEDVENLPEKEEVIVWVELTDLQRVYYKALYSQQIRSLLSGVTNKNLPNLRNLAMELRKVCCHPYLCNSLEDNIADRHREAGATVSELDRMIQSSGKMVLLHKLLPKLKAEGHKVLIFSQFKIMLDVIEDSLNMCGYPSERIDGSIAGRERQAAIDRFTKGGDDTFVFLLSTKAGGQGITLTAADTVVIFDSDWNPQNDLQAMARCHRIGQAKDVTIYRLVCRDTYEQQVFNTASRKYGLDEAILGGMNSKNPEEDATRIADLLKHGAHAVMGQEEVKAKEGEAFAAEGIDEILAGRTEKRQIGSRAGNTFSTAHFAVGDAPGNGPDANGDSRSYWAALMPDAVAAYEEQKAAGPTPLGPRKRRAINYREGNTPAKPKMAPIAEEAGSDKEDFDPGSHDSSDSDTNLDEEGDRRGSRGGTGKRERATGFWTKARVKELEEAIITFGAGHFADIREYLEWGSACSEEELAEVVYALGMLITRADQLSQALENAKAKVKHHEQELDYLKYFPEREASRGSLEQNLQMAKQAASEAALSAAERLIDPDMEPPLPAVARKALEAEQTVSRLLKNGSKYLRLLNERRKLAGLLKGLEAHQSWARCYLDEMRATRQGLNRLPWWWGLDEDLGILAGSYKFGFWPHSARKAVELILNDPSLPTYNRLEFKNAEPLEDFSFLEDNLKDAPDLRNMLSWVHAPTYQPHQDRVVVDDEADWRKKVEALVQRQKALLKILSSDSCPVPGVHREVSPAQAAQAEASTEDPIAYGSEEEEDGSEEEEDGREDQAFGREEEVHRLEEEVHRFEEEVYLREEEFDHRGVEEDGSDIGSDPDSEELERHGWVAPTSSAHAGVQAAGKPTTTMPSMAANAQPVLSAATASAGRVKGAKVGDLKTSQAPASKAPRPASAGKAAKNAELKTSQAPASKAPRPASAGKAAKVPTVVASGLAQTPRKNGKENASQNVKKVASSTKKRLHDVVDLTCSPSPARPAKQPFLHKSKPQASAMEGRPMAGVHGKMKQAKLGFNKKSVGKSMQ